MKPETVPLGQIAYALTWVFRAFFFSRRLWNQPLRDGPGFFLGTEIGPDLDPAERRRWLVRYRAAILAPTLVELALAVWATAHRYWDWYPVLAGAGAVAFTLCGLFVQLWWRRRHPARPPRRVAVSLESRSLAGYTNWPLEVLLGSLLVATWVVLLQGSGPGHWKPPLAFTYAVVGLLAVRSSVVRMSWAFPAEQAESYHRLLEVHRRNSLRVMTPCVGC
jgi:hypothetical protein